MSILTSSINCVDDFTPAENEEVNGDPISLDNDGQFDGKNSETPIIDQQQLKEFREKFARMEMELKMAKLELENKEQKLKHQELMVEHKALKEKMAKIEQEKEKNASEERFSQLQNNQKKLLEKISELEKQQKEQTKENSDQLFKMQNDQKIILEKIIEMEKQLKGQTKAIADQSDQFSKIMVKISEMERQQKQQNENTTKANSDQFSKMQNDLKTILEKISELEKEQKQKRKAFLNFQQNYWDANVCHEKLEIIGHKNLIVHYKGDYKGWRSVFAKHPILLDNNSSNIFYYEISIGKMNDYLISFGFAHKQQTEESYKSVRHKNGTYVYENNGEIWINGEGKGTNAKYSYGVGDTVGIGVHLITRQIILTKNGLCLDFSNFFVAPSFADDSFYYPFVTLATFNDKIEANFGPIFKFDLSTLLMKKKNSTFVDQFVSF